eukprot:5616306-Prymnesium_polylepis.1
MENFFWVGRCAGAANTCAGASGRAGGRPASAAAWAGRGACACGLCALVVRAAVYGRSEAQWLYMYGLTKSGHRRPRLACVKRAPAGCLIR